MTHGYKLLSVCRTHTQPDNTHPTRQHTPNTHPTQATHTHHKLHASHTNQYIATQATHSRTSHIPSHRTLSVWAVNLYFRRLFIWIQSIPHLLVITDTRRHPFASIEASAMSKQYFIKYQLQILRPYFGSQDEWYVQEPPKNNWRPTPTLSNT